MHRPKTEPTAMPPGRRAADHAAPCNLRNAPVHHVIITPPGSGKSVLDLYLNASGHRIIAGSVHKDGPDDSARAHPDAHDVQKGLSALHDAVLEATGKSLPEDKLLMLVAQLPKSITRQIEETGLGNTEVDAHIYHHLKRVSGAARA